MEAKLNRNKIVLPIGTEIWLTANDRKRKVLNNDNIKLVESGQFLKFYALFDQNDVDFEIVIDNTKCVYGIGYTLIINENYYDYYLGPRESWIMETLYTNGRKLHFMSQSTDEGKLIVAETAAEHNMSYAEASAVCSRIEFNFEVEKPTKVVKFANRSGVDVADTAFGSRAALPTVSSNAIITQTDSNVEHQSSITDILERSDRLETLGMTKMQKKKAVRNRLGNKDTVESLDETARAYNEVCDINVDADDLGASDVEVSTEHNLRGYSATIDDDIRAPDINDRLMSAQAVGDRGVICFGEQSNQIYNTYGGFAKDSNFAIKPFIVEMRMSATLTPA